jgi:hypothetical protein
MKNSLSFKVVARNKKKIISRRCQILRIHIYLRWYGNEIRVWRIGEMITAGKSRSTQRKTCLSVTLSTENPTYTVPASAVRARRLAATATARSISNWHTYSDWQYISIVVREIKFPALKQSEVSSKQTENENEVTGGRWNSAVLINLFCSVFPLQTDRQNRCIHTSLYFLVWDNVQRKFNPEIIIMNQVERHTYTHSHYCINTIFT